MGKNYISDPENYGDADEPDINNFDPVSESNSTPEYPRSTTWVVPPGTAQVKVNIKDHTGRILNSYTISNYITLNPGTILEVVAD